MRNTHCQQKRKIISDDTICYDAVNFKSTETIMTSYHKLQYKKENKCNKKIFFFSHVANHIV